MAHRDHKPESSRGINIITRKGGKKEMDTKNTIILIAYVITY